MPTPKNPHRLTAKETLAEAGFDSVEEFFASSVSQDSVVMACCKHGCDVEPDGRCEHGCPSVLLALGVM